MVQVRDTFTLALFFYAVGVRWYSSSSSSPSGSSWSLQAPLVAARPRGNGNGGRSFACLPSLLHLAGSVFSFFPFCCQFSASEHGTKEQSSQSRPQGWQFSDDRPTRMGDRTRQTHTDGRSKRSTHKDGRKRVSERPRRFFRYPATGVRPAHAARKAGTPPARRRVLSSFSSRVGSSRRSSTLRPTSASTGALRWIPRGTQGLFQDARNKVFSVREEVRSATRCSRRPFAFKGSVNSTQPASSEKQSFTRRQRGVKSESTKQATVTPQLFSLVCLWSVKVTSVPVARFLECVGCGRFLLWF